MTIWNAVTGAIVLATIVGAQDQKIFRSDTRLVEVEVVVRDGKGPVQGLKQEDFQLFDNGKPQKIATFGVVTSKGAGSIGMGKDAAAPVAGASSGAPQLPVTATVLFINNLAIAFSDQVQARKRVAEVFHTLLPREPIAVYVLNQNLRILTDFTDDSTRIAKALDAAWGEPPQHMFFCGDIPPAYLALEKIANELGSLPGRKNVLWFANYFPVAKATDPCGPLAYFAMIRTLKALNSANVAVYPINAGGVKGPTAISATRSKAPPIWMNASQGPSGVDGMYWAHETGGTAAQNTDVGFAAQRALDDSQVTYSLGFYPETLDGDYHQLKVKVDRKGVDVRSRAGYPASLPVDLSLPARTEGTTALSASIQAPYFYTGTDRARVHLSLEVVPTGMTFEKKRNAWHGEIEMAGTTLHADGGEAARFGETVNVDVENQERADAFPKTPFHYEREFLLLAGDYFFQMTVGIGRSKEKVTVPLNIEPWHETAFGISGIAFSTDAHPVEAELSEGIKPLVAGGREFVLAAGNRFRPSDHAYFCMEIYEPSLAGPSPATLWLEYRVVDRNTGEVKQNSGRAGVANYVHPGNIVVPFATTLPVAKLEPGLYRLEARATHSSGPDVVARNIDFSVE